MDTPTLLTDDVFSAFLKCRYKAHLKLTGAAGEPSDYEQMQQRLSAEYRVTARTEWFQRHRGAVEDNPPSLLQAIVRGPETITDVLVTDAGESCRLDALERIDAGGRTTKPYYAPVQFVRREGISADDRLLLGFGAGILEGMQGTAPAVGKIVHGSHDRVTKVDLGPLMDAARGVADEIKSIRDGTAAPPLLLNKHCPECEFRQRCRAAAGEKDDLSLLGGLRPKEIAAHNQKGIFTVTQLSYTFRPGRMRRVVEAGGRRHDPALQALAVRENTVYVTQVQPLPRAKVEVFLDVEGLPEPDRFYLIGLSIADGHTSRQFSFWADRPADESAIWAAFLRVIAEAGEDFTLYHYGSYDARALRRMVERYGGDSDLLGRIDARSVNVLGLIHGRVFFPVYGNDLKSVAGFLDFRWATPEASGLQAIAWRHAWEEGGAESVKQTLIAYNQDDCAALRRVVEAIRSFSGDAPPAGGVATRIVNVDDVNVPRGHKFCDPEYVLPEFARIAKTSYFDYQRAHVLVRTSPAVRRANRRKVMRRRPTCPVNQVIEFVGPARCPHCRSANTGGRERYSRTIVDLKPIGGGLKRWVTRQSARRYACNRCGKTWIPDDFLAVGGGRPGRARKYGRTLSAWAAYATIALRQTNAATVEAFDELFGVSIASAQVSRLRCEAADHYRVTYDALLAELRAGRLVHADETWAKVKGSKKRGYVWAFASPEVAYYMYSPSREGETLRQALAGFKGVLVSDFYAAYDSLECPQQKCLVHLIRDVNDDLTKRPFDEELKQQAGRFASLMQAAVQTIDRYGLKQHHLHKHKADVDRFYARETAATYTSEAARRYRQRFLKYRDKLFTFLDHDGVPWNNNNAENAIKRFVSRRRVMGGTAAFSGSGFDDYLVLLSIYQTLRYRGASFWAFLRSGETDIDVFTAKRR